MAFVRREIDDNYIFPCTISEFESSMRSVPVEIYQNILIFGAKSCCFVHKMLRSMEEYIAVHTS